MKMWVVPLGFGIVGCAVLVSLGIWQLQRLAWKEGVLARIEVQMARSPVPIFSEPFEEFMPVVAEGRISGPEVHVLASIRHTGAGFRIVSAFETKGRRILLDQGFVPQNLKNAPRSERDVRIIGNFRTVDEVDLFTPEPDLEANYWFARDIPALAGVLGTEPILIILREISESQPMVTPLPVDTAGIPNDHLGYALTWFALAAVWAGMTGILLRRIGRRSV